MLQTVMWRRAALILLACGVCGAQQERQNPYGSDPDAIEAGRDLRRLEVELPANGELRLTIKLE